MMPRRAVSLPELSFLSFDPTVNTAGQKKGATDEAGRPKDTVMETYTTESRIQSSLADSITVTRDADTVGLDYAMAQRWLDVRMIRGKREIFAEVVTVTPALADLILKRNPDNRNLRKARLAEIKADLQNDNFAMNGESIILSKDGLLNDGQHRLVAVRDTGIPLQTMMVFGVARSSRLTLDQGTSRSSGDYLGMAGKGVDANTVAAVARLIIQYGRSGSIDPSNRGGRINRVVTKSEIVGIAMDREIEIVASIKCTTRCGKWIGSRSFVSFAHWVLAQADHNAATDFFERLVDGAVTAEQPLYTLRQRLIGEPTMSTPSRLEAMVRTWNATRRGEPLTRIMITGRVPAVNA